MQQTLTEKNREQIIGIIQEITLPESLPNGDYPSIQKTAKYLQSLYLPYYFDRGTGEKSYFTFDSLCRIVQKHSHKIGKPERRVKVKQEQPENGLTDKIKSKIFNKHQIHTIESLSDMFDVGISKIKGSLSELQAAGFNLKIIEDKIIFDAIIEKRDETIVSIPKQQDGFYRFGATGDNHLCSRYERLDVLNALYDYFESEGISIVYNTGNWIDGEARFNKHDLIRHGIDHQVNYFIENYPKRKGITTKYVTGDDHEGWYIQREGIDIGNHLQRKAIEAGRNDLVFLGHMEHDEIVKAENGSTKLRVLHPGGGSSYATSYSVQKIVESYSGGDKPDILLCGHYHKAEYTYYRGVHIVQTGCTMDQSPFMRKKKLAAHLGGWTFGFAHDDNGAITRFQSEFFPFYDRKYYKEGWKYRF